jgi:hypothetical protein
MTDDRPARIRALHRLHTPSVSWNGNKQIINQSEQAEQTRIVQEAYDELYPDREIPLGHILSTVHIEERLERGERRDNQMQCWRDASGKKVG